MDPFQKCPSEIRLEIILQLHTRRDLVALTRTSPVMLRQRQTSKFSILGNYVERDLGNGSLVQDAMAVILFPTTTEEGQSGSNNDERTAMIDRHLQQWASNKLPDPFRPADIPTIYVLHSLCRRISLYAEDYLSKATSRYLPWAYRQLPKFAHGDHHAPWDFAEAEGCKPSPSRLVNEGVFDMDVLTDDERRKISQAFLRYEILCKVYGPVQGPSNDVDHKDEEDDGSGDSEDCLSFLAEEDDQHGASEDCSPIASEDDEEDDPHGASEDYLPFSSYDGDDEEDQHGDNEDYSPFSSFSDDNADDQRGDREDFSSFSSSSSSSDDGGEHDESGDTEDDSFSSSDEDEDDKDNKPPSFLHWDWSLLDKYKGRTAQLPDLHLLACVREYILTVYGIMIANHGKAGLLCIPEPWRYSEFENAPLLGARGFPDHGGYCPGWNDVGRWSGWSEPLVSLMATAGLDLLTSTLTSSRKAFRKFMRNFEKEVKHKRPIVRYTNIGASSRSELRRDTFDLPWHCGGLMRLYRQRAWPLFDDDRLYPGSGGLSTAREYWGLCSERGYSTTGIGVDAGSGD